MADKTINVPTSKPIPLGSWSGVSCGKYLKLDIAAQAQIKNCKLTISGSENPDQKKSLETGLKSWFHAKSKMGTAGGKLFSDCVIEKPHVSTEGFDIELKAKSKFGAELLVDLKFIELTNKKAQIPLADPGHWPEEHCEVDVTKTVKLSADIYPVVQIIGHPEYKEILKDAGIKAMKTQLGKQALKAVVKMLAENGLTELAGGLEGAGADLVAAGVAEETAGGAAVVLGAPVVITAVVIGAVVIVGYMAVKAHDSKDIAEAKIQVAVLCSQLWHGFQAGIIGGNSPSDAGKEAFNTGAAKRHDILDKLKKQNKHASEKALDEAIKKACGPIFNDKGHFEKVHDAAREAIWKDYSSRYQAHWYNSHLEDRKTIWKNIYGTDAEHDSRFQAASKS